MGLDPTYDKHEQASQIHPMYPAPVSERVNLPRCPACQQPIDTIFTSRTVHLKFKDSKWVEEQQDRYCVYACPECLYEFSPEELDQLGVPNEIR